MIDKFSERTPAREDAVRALQFFSEATGPVELFKVRADGRVFAYGQEVSQEDALAKIDDFIRQLKDLRQIIMGVEETRHA
jgi:hypothetical protein